MSSVSSDAIFAEISIKASAERIFKALTDPEQRVKWWGLKGRFETTEVESDLRVGGRWAMRGNGMGGKPFNVVGTYRIIEPPRVLAFTWLPSWDEEASETFVRFDLSEQGGITTVRLPIRALPPKARGPATRAGRKSCPGCRALWRAEATLFHSAKRRETGSQAALGFVLHLGVRPKA